MSRPRWSPSSPDRSEVVDILYLYSLITQILWLYTKGASLESNLSVYLTDGPITHRGQDWQEIVEQYSRYNLTYKKDRLVILSGLTKRQ